MTAPQKIVLLRAFCGFSQVTRALGQTPRSLGCSPLQRPHEILNFRSPHEVFSALAARMSSAVSRFMLEAAITMMAHIPYHPAPSKRVRSTFMEMMMPFNKLHVPQDLPAATCHAINGILHDSLVATCNVNPNDFFCLVCRYPAADMIFHPTYLGNRDPAATIVIEIALLAGRSDSQKEALYAAVRTGLGRMGFEPANSIMFLVENNPVDWSFSPMGSVKSVLGL